MKNRILIGLFMALFVLIGCKKGITDETEDPWVMDAKIQQITFYGRPFYETPAGDAQFPNYKDGKIFYLKILNYLTSNDNQGLWSTDSAFSKLNSLLSGRFWYFTVSKTSDECLVVQNFEYLSSGDLYTYNIQNQQLLKLHTGLDIVYGAISAKNDSLIILYGEMRGKTYTRGYYQFERTNNKLKLLFAVPKGLYGFDISPDNKFLLCPAFPKYLIYNMETGKIDSGKIGAAWLRFNSNGTKLCYSSNTLNNHIGSSVGIVHFPSGVTESLDIELINPNIGLTFIAGIVWTDNDAALAFSGVPITGLGVPGPLGYTNIYLYQLK